MMTAPSADDALAGHPQGTRDRHPGKRVFCTLADTPVSDRYVRDMLNRAAGKPGSTNGFTRTACGNTFAVELKDVGTQVTTISKLLGHSSVAVTARYLKSRVLHQPGEESAGQQVISGPLSDPAPPLVSSLTSGDARPSPSDARTSRQRGKINDYSACR
jgi:hypothetical protein